MFENLSDKLEKAFKTLKGKGSISEINVLVPKDKKVLNKIESWYLRKLF